ncbi:MAG TPA: hypothetical protein VL284_17350, partial [Thermoanaerobaculia bacterium]|nr:hypothetical protein [Thermoanaerobaculia bacterium]
EIRDFDRHRLLDNIESRGYETENWATSDVWTHSAVLVDGGLAFNVSDPQHPAPGRAREVQLADERLAFGPERVLLTALEANDLTREPDAMLHGFLQHVVRFTRGTTSVRLWISPANFYPAAVDLTRARPYDIFWAPWGDVTTRITWNFWNLEPSGIHVPREWTWESNGQPEKSLTINVINFNAELRAPDVESLRDASRKRMIAPEELPLGKAVEVAPGVTQIAGFWNVEEVREADGIVIIEGPISNGYSAKVLDDVAKRFPGVPVKAVITTSDSWPHIGGLREYVARGIDIYALDRNAPILDRLVTAPHRMQPDALQKHPRRMKLHLVSSPMRFGSMTLIPLREVTGERQMAVWFPPSRLLYTSDLFQKLPDGTWFTPQYLSEMESVVARDHLDPQTIFGMHYGPTAWSLAHNAHP